MISRLQNFLSGKKYLVLSSTILLAIFLFFTYGNLGSQSAEPREHFIELRDDGFHPDELSITVGDVVTFTTTREKEFWPASDLHPTHRTYPEFDPRKPISANESWSFTFEELGNWRFHDHLSSNFRGTIIVGNEFIEDTCIKDSSDTACLERVITDALDSGGVEAALDSLVLISKEQKGFGAQCHEYAHLIGEEAYDLFTGNESLGLTAAVSNCSYGFFHGFMETLLYTTADFELARSFCEYVDSTLSKSGSSGSFLACYHGIGHGFADGGDPRFWGDADAMSAPAIDMCKKVSSSDIEEYVCVSGVFNSLEILATDSKYELDEINEEPFEFCDRQPLSYLEPCYTNMLISVLRITENNFAEAMRYVDARMQNRGYPSRGGTNTEGMVVLSLMSEFIRLHGSDKTYVEDGLEICRSLPERLHASCVGGLAFGHIKYSSPADSQNGFLNFCSYEGFTDLERDGCYRDITDKLRTWYDDETSEYICNNVPSKHQGKSCRV